MSRRLDRLTRAEHAAVVRCIRRELDAYVLNGFKGDARTRARLDALESALAKLDAQFLYVSGQTGGIRDA